jgi:hypothetical protein
MKLPARSVAWLLPFLLTGCFEVPFHKAKPATANALAPYLRPSHTLELIEVELPPEDTVIAANAVYNMWEVTEPIRPPVRRRRLQSPEETAVTPDAASPPNPEVSAIGQLSSGDPASSRQQTEDSITDIERRLNGINRPLSDSEQKTANHIREFLKQARAALASGDVEGAHTLAGKAQVLLMELTK